MGVKNFLKRIFGREKVEALAPAPEITSLQFYSHDGDYVSVTGITKLEVPNYQSNTILYSAQLVKGVDENGLNVGKKICFELPSSMSLNQAQASIECLVSSAYNNTPTRQFDEQYNHIGVINYDQNGRLQMYNPGQNVLQWVDDKLKAPLRQEKFQAEENRRRSEEKWVQRQELKANRKQRKIENQEYDEKFQRYYHPIFEQEPDAFNFNKPKYTIYQQPSFNDPNQTTGYSTLKNVENITAFTYPDGTLTYVYSANLFNHYEKNPSDGFAQVYPKVCFELPCSLEEMETKMQNGDNSIVQYLGVILSNAHLASKELKTDGTQTWVGRVKEDVNGARGIDDRISPYVQDYINRENEAVRRMNAAGRSGYQPNLGEWSK